ncbi:uncharacterized protein L969DRAFT_83964 [Mixia osmundae IAM 14324]|uniref:Mitochondrial distribution and morphology protein 31 n=1 Tax=Mixia osmundae (strain CBS 9802 / IAM 14324 / JCM 22182 / KY 12970) TaxID=764103 RepID=G7DV70_MIXOS|nr:uncharacterized protein L969DRAFT_83964 [Mixia osmundae IAM 14324]KEI42096.1 hypothetical protein L969DRAFT_83964 [Mixia osmundae IAM 14324]GAA94480.1 hypothetical protein E5Q_01132 [Mixia osmundae IAM 14324]
MKPRQRAALLNAFRSSHSTKQQQPRVASAYAGLSRYFSGSVAPQRQWTARPSSLSMSASQQAARLPVTRSLAASAALRDYKGAANEQKQRADAQKLSESQATQAESDGTTLHNLQQSVVHSIPSLTKRKQMRDELLSRATGFFERLKIRFKWFTIRGFRSYKTDDYSAFVSFFLGGVGLWIAIGTTSFFASIFFLANSLQLQESLARKLGSYLTASSGVTIVFESAIVPRFSLKDSRISFKNVYISRGPVKKRAIEPLMPQPNDDEGVQVSSERAGAEGEYDPAKANWSYFHLQVDSIEVSLSLWRWLDGKGLVKDAVVKGVRGVLDRSHIVTDPKAVKDRTAFRHTARPGDFHLETLELEDFLVTVHQPYGFRPYNFSIFHASIPTLRKQWLFLDMLSADSITGQVDNCLFSLHKPQSIGRTSEEDLKDGTWKRMSRFRVDGVPIDHLQSPHDEGPISWITSGRADLVADIRFPRQAGDDVDLSEILGDLVERIDETISSRPPPADRIPGQPQLATGKPLEAPKSSIRSLLGLEEHDDRDDDAHSAVTFDLDIRFKDLKATIPIFDDHLSYANNALVRPIVAFLNSNRTLIPIKCHVELPLPELDGSWTTHDTGLLDLVSEQVYAALAHHVQTQNDRRAKVVGLWSLQMTAQAVLTALRGRLDPY